MNFRSLSDLVEITRQGLAAIPGDVEIIVGIPRSGMLPASILALLLNKPLLDFESLIAGRLPTNGLTRTLANTINDMATVRRVLIVDDSVSSGRNLAEVRRRLSEARPDIDAVYLAVIASPRSRKHVDIALDICREPRIFEWNLMNSGVCESACFDLDGIFCRDPSDDENDDGKRYAAFIENVGSINVPGRPLRRIVTSRLETYRAQTEAWLERHGIAFDRLDMMHGVTARERREGKLHAPFKAKIYAADKQSILFVESDSRQAHRIAQLSGKPVLDFSTMRIVGPDTPTIAAVRHKASNGVRRLWQKIRKIPRKLRAMVG